VGTADISSERALGVSNEAALAGASASKALNMAGGEAVERAATRAAMSRDTESGAGSKESVRRIPGGNNNGAVQLQSPKRTNAMARAWAWRETSGDYSGKRRERHVSIG
jgi:hypothetical protein